MHQDEAIPSIVFSAHALARIAAHESGNEAPSTQWRALCALTDHGPQRVGELARRARATQPGMTRLVGQLEHEGLVGRAADPDDSRATIVTATDRGRRALDAWREELRGALAPRFAGLDDADWEHLVRAAEIFRERTSIEGSTR